MFDLSCVVTGTDFSETSKGALSEALRLVRGRPEGRIVVVHVCSPKGQDDELEQRLATFVDELPAARGLQAQLELRVVAGHVSEVIAQVAEEVEADLIVVGPLQKGFIERYLTGGTAEQLFNKTHVPVLATRARAEVGYGHILVPIDFSEHSGAVVRVAAEFARDKLGAVSEGVHLDLLHVFDIPGGVHAVGALKSLEQKLMADFTHKLKAFAKKHGVSELVHTCRAIPGVPQQVIPEEAESCGADLICMGSGGAGIGKRLLGSTTSAVMSEVELPMLVLWA